MVKKLLSVLLAVCLLVGIAPMAFATNANSDAVLRNAKSSVSASAVVAEARKLIGYKYVWGGKSPSAGGFDCSGLVFYVYHTRLGYDVDYPTIQSMSKAANFGTKITNVNSFQPGDIVYGTTSSGVHMGIYTGDRKFIDAGSSKGVSERNVVNGWFKISYAVRFPGVIEDDIPPPPSIGHSTLRSGSSGSEVSLLQNLLNSVQNAGLSVDGKYGPATVTAVKRFQQAHGLTVDGVCGPSTWSALEAAKAVGTTSKPSASVSGKNVTITWSYSGGGTSIDVHLIQAPWGWNDIKYKQVVSPSSTSCTFSNVIPGYYRAFTIARPNADTVQSEWVEFTVSESHTTHTKGSFIRTGTEHPHYNYYTCTVCGQEFTDSSTSPDNYCKECHWEHVWDAGKVTKEPTLTENGIRTYTCTICGSMKEESISSTTSIVIPFPDYEPHLQGMYTITSDGSLRVSKDSNFFMPLYENLVKSDIYKQYRTSITKLIFEEGVTSIGDGFLGSNSQYALDNVTSIELPSSLKKLGMGAFRFCPSVERIYIPESVSEIEYRAFSGCKSLKRIEVSENSPCFKSADGIVYTKDMSKLIAFPEGWSGDYAPPAQLTSVDRLINCSKVNSATIPNGQTEIFSNTFMGCKNLRNVTVPKTVNKIHYSSFAGCSNLTDIYYEGTVEDWNKIEITEKGEYDAGEDASGIILNATKHFSSPSTPTPPSVTPDIAFSDVSAGAYYAKPVVWAVENGITSGTGKNQFTPDSPCTREQIVTFLWRAADKPEPQTSISPFSDVKPTDYFYKAVLWAVENNITSGEGQGKFGSGNTCSRSQAVTFLWRAAKEPNAVATNSFIDVKSGSYYEKAMNWAVANKVSSGTSATTFSPDESCTRGQIVTFLYRANN